MEGEWAGRLEMPFTLTSVAGLNIIYSRFYTLVFLGIFHGRGKEKKDGVLETEHRNAPSATVLWQVKVPVVGLRHMGRWCHLNTVKMG